MFRNPSNSTDSILIFDSFFVQHQNNRRQGRSPESAARMQDLHVVKERPLQVLRIPCICGERHSTGVCPTTEQAAKHDAPTTPRAACSRKRKKTSRQSTSPSAKRRWSEFRRQARRRNIMVEVTERHYMTLIKQPCGYCGSTRGKGRRIGVDRVQNDQHYTTENTIACCAVCNFMKRDLGVRAFVHAAHAVCRGPMASHLCRDRRRAVGGLPRSASHG